MMRYQRVCLPRKTSTISTTFTPPPQTIKPRSGSGSANPLTTQTHHEPSENNNSSNKNHEISKELVLQWGHGHQDPFDNHNSSNNNHEISKELILQWGHKKRSRGSRAAENPNHDNNRTAGDEPSARQMIKIQRRAAIVGAEKIAAVAAAMPPPAFCSTRGANLRGCTTATTTHHIRNVEERSGGQSRSEKRSPSQPNKPHNNHQHHKKPGANGFRSDAAVSSMNQDTKAHHPSDQENLSPAAAEKLNLGQFEWPRIYLSLSRKEKEDDFLAMKGTKLSQRPKKRAKNIDKPLQYCFPGMWLSDLTRSRYEVREKKCVKKKRRGLKGMESMDSDSE